MTVPWVLSLSAAGLGVTGLIALPAFFAQLSQIRDRTPRDNFYQDVDGKSTPETMAAFSNTKPKVCLLIFSITGLGLSLAVTVLSILHPLGDGLALENWLSNGCWVSRLKTTRAVSPTADVMTVNYAFMARANHSPTECAF